jgi:cytochrome bd-type quinol oxidase subunit 2
MRIKTYADVKSNTLMDYTTIGITVLWTFLFLYIIVASIDFGAGFFTYKNKKVQSTVIPIVV